MEPSNDGIEILQTVHSVAPPTYTQSELAGKRRKENRRKWCNRLRSIPKGLYKVCKVDDRRQRGIFKWEILLRSIFRRGGR